MRGIEITKNAQKQLKSLKKRHETAQLKRIKALLEDIRKSPFSGIGKPEALKHNFQGYWSRRITQEHRLVYQVTDEKIIILSCVGHYG